MPNFKNKKENINKNENLAPYQGAEPLTREEAIKRLQAYISGRKRITQARTPTADEPLDKDERQTEVFERKLDMFEQGNVQGFITAPGGFGKSKMIKDDILAFRPNRALILGPTNIIVNQIYEDLTTKSPLLDVGVIDKSRKEYGRHITVSTYQSFLKGAKEYKAAKESGALNPQEPKGAMPKGYEIKPKDMMDLAQFDFVICDEAHRALGDATKQMLRAMQVLRTELTQEPITIGYTATPMYSYEKRVSHLLGHEIDRIGAVDAARSGWISSFKVYHAVTSLSLDDVEMERGKVKDYKQSSLRKVINTEAANHAAIETYQYEEFFGRPCLIFCVDVEHAQTVARIFNEAGIPSAAVWGEQDVAEREAIVKGFKNRSPLVVTCADVLREGFNYEELEVVFNLRPMRSYVAVEQRFYRAARIDKANPTKFGKVVEFIYQSEIPEKMQVTIDQLLGTAQVAYTKDIAELMRSELFERKRQVIVVEAGRGIERVRPKVSGLKCIVHDPVDVMAVSRTMLERRLNAKMMPEHWVPWSEFLRYRGINKPWALSVLQKFRNDKDEVGSYVSPYTGLIELCISKRLMSKMVRAPPIKQNEESVTLLARSLNMSVGMTLKLLKERNATITEYKVQIDRKKAKFVKGELANELRVDEQKKRDLEDARRQDEETAKQLKDPSAP
ncbi:MAG: DEAD/DEAH box helicase family protein [Candidatus Micrarchaeota archaeon]|nr:DEAD/DEAH box helicase family protein [Candidatus Micrarchaeota archaeon]